MGAMAKKISDADRRVMAETLPPIRLAQGGKRLIVLAAQDAGMSLSAWRRNVEIEAARKQLLLQGEQ
jgi:hypothetical protein